MSISGPASVLVKAAKGSAILAHLLAPPGDRAHSSGSRPRIEMYTVPAVESTRQISMPRVSTISPSHAAVDLGATVYSSSGTVEQNTDSAVSKFLAHVPELFDWTDPKTNKIFKALEAKFASRKASPEEQAEYREMRAQRRAYIAAPTYLETYRAHARMEELTAVLKRLDELLKPLH